MTRNMRLFARTGFKVSRKMSAGASCLLVALLTSGVSICYADTIPFDSPRWEIDAKDSRVEEHLGRQSLFLKGGTATLQDTEFTDGIVEFDIAFTGERGFMGGIWRFRDSANYEEFYVRPHQSGKPDASQYTPIFNGTSGWQLYHGEGYGAAIDYENDKWLHIKIVVSGDQAEVFVGDGDVPTLFISELKRGQKAGSVGIFCGNFAPAYFSNFNYTSMSAPELKGEPLEREAAESGAIMSWSVSNVFDEAELNETAEPDEDGYGWTRLECESSGLANLARVSELGEGGNTVFARLSVTSEVAQGTAFQFGYSDRAKVYLNGKLIYSGDNTYRSRDFRYLGTIGLFDELYLPLEKGENKIWIAVSESFGGWGLMARLPDTTGLTVDASIAP